MSDARGNGSSRSSAQLFKIDEGFQEMFGGERADGAGAPRHEFADAVLPAFHDVSLARVLDSEFERQNGSGAVNGATRILRRVLGKLRGE